MDPFSRKALPFRYVASSFSGKILAFALLISTFTAFLLLPSTAQAKLIRVEAVGNISFIHASLQGNFNRGDVGRMVLTYDTSAKNEGQHNTGFYQNGAVKFFQIFDEKFQPYFEYKAEPSGIIRVNDWGAKGDSFGVEAYSGVRFHADPDNGLRGTDRNYLLLMGAFFNLKDSYVDVLQDAQLPWTLGTFMNDWSNTQPPSFELQYCSGCGTGAGAPMPVRFRISHIEVSELTDTLMSFTVKDRQLVAQGEIDATALDAFEKATRKNQSIKTLVLQNAPGSSDDDANLVLSKRLRAKGFSTTVPTNGLIASGGVDLFLAGVERTLEAGACVGVHSWEGGGIQGKDYPRNSPEHAKYLDYFRSIGIKEELYWFTLQVAAANQMHYMTQAEVNKYGVTTTPAPVLGTQTECEARP